MTALRTILGWTGLLTGCGLLACSQPPEPQSPDDAAATAALEPRDEKSADPFRVPPQLAPTRWLVLGPFPLQVDAEGKRSGFERDYLSALGGEEQVELTAETSLEQEGKTFQPRVAEGVGPLSLVDFTRVFESETDHKLAYAYAELESGSAGVLQARFGSDDSAQVWVNGKSVHRVVADRGVDADGDQFEVPVVAGKNRIIVKVDNGQGGWGFALRLFDEAGLEQLEVRQRRQRLDSLMPAPSDDRYLLSERFPELRAREVAARSVFGDASPVVRWFGPDLKQVPRPGGMGRYVAVVEQRSLDGDVHRRALHFAKGQPFDMSLLPAPFLGEARALVEVPGTTQLNPLQRDELGRQIWAAGAVALREGPEAALTWARVWELQNEEVPAGGSRFLQGSLVRAAEHELALRMSLENRTARPLKPPTAVQEGAPPLRKGTEAEALVRPGSRKLLRKLSREWAKEDPNGFVVLAARKGVVFFHEGFNGFEPKTPFRPASLGKTIFGLLFARAVDQGLLSFDQPVGEVLPDWSQGKLGQVTFRNLFNHVAGLTGHSSHGGLFNPYLDNALALQDAKFAEVRSRFYYNGDDLNLAAKALELTTGTSAFRLLYDNLQAPFDASVLQNDMGYGHAFTAQYLARIGQMILRDGAYAGKRFYSPGFLQQLWPKPIAESVPGFEGKEEWGIGLEWMVDPAGPRSEGAFGPNVIGHGAASGSVWRVIPDHDVVLVVGRDRYAGSWGDNERRIDRFVVGAAGMLPETDD